jgi:membrane-associated HD superfamily phosphohydrolase
MMSANLPLKESSSKEELFHPVIRIAARIISFIFHPLFIPVYISWFLIYINPLFPAINPSDKWILLLRFIVMYTVFPLVTLFLAKGLGFIQSIFLKTQKDRIIPYIVCGIYYFWMWYVLKNQPEFPRYFVMLSLAIFIASFLGLIVNSFMKVSMHAISVGVMITFILLLAFLTDANYGFYIAIAFLLAGTVSSARLINSDHYPVEVYAGLVVGIVAQLVAYYFL